MRGRARRAPWGLFVAATVIGGALLGAPAIADDPAFSPQTAFPAGSGPAAVAVGDLNNDGKPDLAVANAVAPGGGVTILLGDGTGAFGPPATVDAPFLANPYGIAAADFNRDGRLDLAVTDIYGTGISSVATYGAVLLGSGTGTFTADAVEMYGGLANLFAVQSGDVNSDGAPDLVTVGATRRLGETTPIGFVAAHLGDGSGGFPARKVSTGGEVKRSVALGNLNADGRLDVATATSGREDFPGDVLALFGNGTGEFGADAGGVAGRDAGDGATSVAQGDFNRDGTADLVTANYTSDDVTVFLGTGGGALAPGLSFPAHDGPRAVRVGEFTGDGIPDLAVVNALSRDVSVLVGTGSGSFGAPSGFAVGEMFTLVASRYHGDGGRIAVGDFNCNGTDDLAVANDAAGTVSILMNARPGTKPAGCAPDGGDTSAPAVKIVSKKLRMTKAVPVKLRCPAGEPTGCRAKVTLTTAKKVKFAGANKRVTLGTASKTLPAGKATAVKVKIRAKKRTLVKRLGSLSVKVSVRATDQAGNARTVTKTLTLRAA